MFDQAVNVNLVVALMVEAKPFIDQFKLTPQPEHRVFKIYSNRNVSLIISGIGRTNAAAAVAYLGAQFSSANVSLWINFGIAGHRSQSIGELVIAHKILEKASGHAFYPLVYPVGLTSTELVTVDVPETGYANESAFDMEASGFAAVASKFTSLEFIQSVKVISDNAKSGIAAVSKSSIENLMHGSAAAVAGLVDVMLPSAAHRSAQIQLPQAFEHLLATARFSVTQTVQLKRLCQRYSALGLEQRLTEIAGMEFGSAKKIIQFLEAQLRQHIDIVRDS